MFYAIDVEARVRADHPLRPIKAMVDAELARMGHLFNKAYSGTGRPSVPPEVLLKALLLKALYAIRSEAQLVERIDTDLLFRWFLDMDPAAPVFDATAFTHIVTMPRRLSWARSSAASDGPERIRNADRPR